MSTDRVTVNFDTVSGLLSPPVMYTNLKLKSLLDIALCVHRPLLCRALVSNTAIIMTVIIMIRKCWDNGDFVDLHNRILNASARTNLSSFSLQFGSIKTAS